MRKTKLVMCLFSALITTASYANWDQHEVLCLNVDANTSPYEFYASFVSSDLFDSARAVKLRNGQKCVDHTYSHGPKNIKLEVMVADFSASNDIKMIPDSTCDMLYSRASAWYMSDYIRTAKHSEGWNISLTQISPQPGYKYTYKMTCSHQAS